MKIPKRRGPRWLPCGKPGHVDKVRD